MAVASSVLVGALFSATPAGAAPAVASAAAAAPLGFEGAWTSVFDDEFNGSSLDSAKWSPNRYGADYGGDTPFNPAGEDAWFGTRNVSVSGGNLALTVQPQPEALNGKTYPYSSGVVQTQDRFHFKPGTYVEARINIPRCDGCWPAFWSVAPNAWPPELDAFEFFNTGGSGDDVRPQFNYHPPSGGQTGPTPYGQRGTDYLGSFHTYGMLWDGNQAVPYLDGQAYPAGANRDMTRLDQFLILNLSVQAGHRPAAGSQMLVDWVHAWTPGPGAAPGLPPVIGAPSQARGGTGTGTVLLRGSKASSGRCSADNGTIRYRQPRHQR